MWLFSQQGMFSIVDDISDPGCLLVRARVKGDIEKYWPDAAVERREDTDYLYRATIKKGDVVNALIKMVLSIDYTNFKDSIEDERRSLFYARVWANMSAMQESLDEDG
jgi:hypothetical protein